MRGAGSAPRFCLPGLEKPARERHFHAPGRAPLRRLIGALTLPSAVSAGVTLRMSLETEAVLDRRRMRRRLTFWRSAAVLFIGLLVGALLFSDSDLSNLAGTKQ